MKYAPICLFTYNRLEELKRTVFALQTNYLANQSALYIFSDGWKNSSDKVEVLAVRSFLYQIKGFKKVSIFEAPENRGLAVSITKGVSEVCKKYGRVIVLEDDILTSKGFLVFMNQALDYYYHDEEVFQVSGFMFPINSEGLPDTFFYQANSCWGWATWQRSWENFTDKTTFLFEQLQKKNIDWKNFNAMQGNEYKKQLIRNLKGNLSTWAVKWHAIIKINNGKVIHPKTSFVLNIGFSGNGENCSKGDSVGSINDNLQLDVSHAATFDNNSALLRLKKYFKKYYSLTQKMKRKVKKYF